MNLNFWKSAGVKDLTNIMCWCKRFDKYHVCQHFTFSSWGHYHNYWPPPPPRIYGGAMSKYSSPFVKGWHQQPLHISIRCPTSYFYPPAPLYFCHGSSLGNQCMYVSRHVNSPFLQSDHFVFLSWKLDDMLRSLTWFSIVLSTIFLISWKCINWTSDHLGAPSRLASLQRQKKL